jgi:hypothetical protein
MDGHAPSASAASGSAPRREAACEWQRASCGTGRTSPNRRVPSALASRGRRKAVRSVTLAVAAGTLAWICGRSVRAWNMRVWRGGGCRSDSALGVVCLVRSLRWRHVGLGSLLPRFLSRVGDCAELATEPTCRRRHPEVGILVPDSLRRMYRRVLPSATALKHARAQDCTTRKAGCPARLEDPQCEKIPQC